MWEFEGLHEHPLNTYAQIPNTLKHSSPTPQTLHLVILCGNTSKSEFSQTRGCPKDVGTIRKLRGISRSEVFMESISTLPGQDMDLEPKDIGIITPYARQVAALRFGVLGGRGWRL